VHELTQRARRQLMERAHLNFGYYVVEKKAFSSFKSQNRKCVSPPQTPIVQVLC